MKPSTGSKLLALTFIFLASSLGGCEPQPTTATRLLSRPPVSDDAQALAASNTQFALDLYGQLQRPATENLCFSPYSISTALAMTYGGARNETAQEMAATLHFDLPQNRLHPAFQNLAANLVSSGQEQGYQLSIANRLWCRSNENLLEDYLALTRDHYGAAAESLDFVGDAEGSRAKINAWVADQTADRIKDLLGPGVIDASTIMVLTNAVYFKGPWKSKFLPEQTRPQDFQIAKDTTVSVPMMTQTAEFRYFEQENVQVLELPYEGGDLSMILLLPAKGIGITEFEQQITSESMQGWLKSLAKQEVQVSVPKFKLTSEFELSDELGALGMPSAFSAAADFSGISGAPDRSISDVIHKAFIEVSEEGTEAAAATAIVMRESAMEYPMFVADRPFVFLIQDTRTGSVLFMGRLANPS